MLYRAWWERQRRLRLHANEAMYQWELHNNWRRWFGWDIRRWVDREPWDYTGWEYGRSKQVAHQQLKQLYG